MLVTFGLSVVALLLVFLVRPVGRARTVLWRGPSDTLVSRQGSPVILQIILGILAIGTAGATMYFLFKAGDSGAHMVWSGF